MSAKYMFYPEYDFEFAVRDEFITRVAEMVTSDPAAALRASFDQTMCDVLMNLTPERRAFIHEHFHEMFEFTPGAFDEIKRRLRPS